MFGWMKPSPPPSSGFDCDRCKKRCLSTFSCGACDSWVCHACSTLAVNNVRRCDPCHAEMASLSKHARRRIDQ